MILSIVGILNNFYFVYIRLKLLQCNFPIPQVPWAMPMNKYYYFERLLRFTAVFLVSFQTWLTSLVDHYVLLIPIILLQSIQMWILLFNRASFTPIIDTTLVVKDSVIWTCSVFAIALSMSSNYSDASYCILTVIAICAISAVILLQKKEIFAKQL